MVRKFMIAAAPAAVVALSPAAFAPRANRRYGRQSQGHADESGRRSLQKPNAFGLKRRRELL